MNSQLKRLAELTIARSGALSVVRAANRTRAVVLAYHNVVPNGDQARGDASLHLLQRHFAAQLDLLMETHDVVPLTSLFADRAVSKRPRVAITFDDAYEGSLTAGIEELVRRRLPATVFVTPALLGKDTWWDVIANPAEGAVPEHARRHALEFLGGDRDAVIDWAAREGMLCTTAPAPHRIGDEKQLLDASRQDGIALGSHTWSHRNLAVLAAHELESELSRPAQWLRDRFDSVIPWLTYPYGRYSPDVEAAAARAGYAGAFRVDGGWLSSNTERSQFALERINIPAGISIEGFAIRLAGLAANR
jgi:peptidoglycan/xylan/chitin deacetylase (PgdA/CDA1 family)